MNRCILLLSSSHRLMRVFGAIVPAQPLLVRAGQPQTPERRGVGAQLVGDQQFGCEALLLEQLAHQPQRRPSVASALDQHVEDLALTARQRYIRSPAIRTTISSRCQQLLRRGRHRRSRRAITGPNFSTQHRTVS